MKRLFFIALFLFGTAVPANAQYTAVTATVLDPTGAPYANCHGDAVFVASPTATTQPFISGSLFQTDVIISQCDSFARLAIQLVDNNQVSDGHTGGQTSQWRFNISSQDGKTNFNCTMTVTGANQDVTAALQACAAPLPAQGGGGGNFIVKNIACASAITFTMAGVAPNTSNTAFIINPLNCNVTTTSVAPPAGGTLQRGAVAQFTLVNSGGFSFAWPSNFIDQPTIQSGVNATTNASFWYDGTNWRAQTFPASGGGGGSPSGTAGTIQSTNGSTFSSSSVSEPPSGSLAGSLKVNEDLGACGPNPYVDIRCYGARAVNTNTTPAAVGLTAACTNGQNTVTISSASTFVNGDGAVLYGCGNPHSMTTPSAPAVTPSIAEGSPGTGLVINGPAGVTTYNYKIIARDKNGGLTAASSAGSTTTGATSLGAQTPLAISTVTVNNNIATFTTSSAHGFAVCNINARLGCGEVFLQGFTPTDLNGWWDLASVTDSTHFTIATIYDTRNGTLLTPTTNGTVQWLQCNHLSWTQVTGAWNYYIYSDRASPGTYALIGTSRPQGTQNTDTTFDDFGSPMMDNQTFPPYVPTTPPSSATSDNLSTTITAGAGTTTLTLASAAGTTCPGAGCPATVSIRIDDGPAIVAAASAINTGGAFAGTLWIPAVGAAGNSFVVNSYTDLTPYNISVSQAGPLLLNETLATKATTWYGDRHPQAGDFNLAGTWQGNAVTTVGTANPGIYNSAQFGVLWQGMTLTSPSIQNGQLLALFEGGFNMAFFNDSFVTATGNNDYMGIGLYLRGKASVQSATNILVDRVLFSSGLPSPIGAPLWYCNDCGQGTVRSAYYLHRGAFWREDPANGAFTVTHSYINGGHGPLYTITGPSGGVPVNLGTITLDTFGEPALTGINTNLFVSGGPGLASSGNPAITGGIASIVNNGGNLFNARNSTAQMVSPTGVVDGFLNSFAGNGDPYLFNFYAGALGVAPSYPLFIAGVPQAAPSSTVNAGGSIATGTYQFRIVPVWQNNGEGTPSPLSAAVTTTTGNQALSLTWVAAAGNPKAYDIYWCNSNGTSCNGGAILPTNLHNLTGTSVSITSFGSLVNTAPSPFFPAGGPTMLMPGTQGIVAPVFTLTGGNFADVFSFTGTANRSLSFPDASGTVAVSATSPVTLSAAGAVACPNCFDKSTNNSLGANFFDIGTRASPGNPSAGNIRLYADSTSGNLTCLTSAGANCIPGGGGGTPGGSNTQVQFNASGAFAGNANLTFVSPALSVGSAAGATGQVKFVGTTSGTVTTQSQDAAGTWTFKWPTSGGTNGFPLTTDGTGVSSWSLLSYAGGGTGATTFTNGQLVGSGSSALTNVTGAAFSNTGSATVLTLKPGAATGTALAVDTQASPTGHILDVKVNGTITSFFDSSAFLNTPQVTFNGSGPLGLSGIQGTCPSVVAGSYTICLGDLGTLMANLSNNGQPYKPIAQLSNASPAAHGVGMAGVTAPQINFSAAGLTGQPFLSGGASADGAYGALNLAGGSNIVTGILPTANGGTGASSISGANIITVTGAVTVGHCASFQASTVIQDAGSACGGGASPARLDQITAATANVAGIANANFSIRWNWALTGSTTAFIYGESAASTGSNNILLQATTASASTATVFQADNNGAGWKVGSTGTLAPVGGSAFDASGLTPANGFKVQVATGCTAGADGAECYDSTNKNQHVRTNGADSIVGAFASIPTTADLVDTSVASSNTLLHDSGIATANVVTQTSNAANNQICAYTGANKVCVPTTTLPTAAFPALTGDVTTSAGSLATTIAANAVTSAKMTVVNTRRTCAIIIGADNGAAALANADIAPQGRQCFIPFAATVVEIEVAADAGTPNVIVAKNHAGTLTDLLSSALATAASGGIACSNTGGTTGFDGATTCSSTLQNTSLSIGDYLETHSATAGGTAKRMSIFISYAVN